MKQVLFSICIAALLWFLMFSPYTRDWVNFWASMSFSAIILSILAGKFHPQWTLDISIGWKTVCLGILIAVALWCVFWLGDKVTSFLFAFARPQVDLIYSLKDGENKWLLAALLFIIIGPAEEVFWRGYIQRVLSDRWSPNIGFVFTTLFYALVHIWSFNFMLIMAALVVGIAWGLLYRFYPKQLSAIMLSHALWDVAVFVLFPI